MDATLQTICQFASRTSFAGMAERHRLAARHALIEALGELVMRARTPSAPRALAAQWPQPGATVIGTTRQAALDLAVLCNAASAGDAVAVAAAVIASAEAGGAPGHELLAGLAMAEGVRRALAERVGPHFCSSNAVCIAAAAGAARMLGLTDSQTAQAVGLSAVTDAVLEQKDPAWRGLAAAMAARAGVFAAMTAKAGMVGPVLPFEGKTGWSSQIASLDAGTTDLALSLPELPSDVPLPGPAGLDRILGRLHRIEKVDQLRPILLELEMPDLATCHGELTT